MIPIKISQDLEILDTHPQIWYQYQFENPDFFPKNPDHHPTPGPGFWYVPPPPGAGPKRGWGTNRGGSPSIENPE